MPTDVADLENMLLVVVLAKLAGRSERSELRNTFGRDAIESRAPFYSSGLRRRISNTRPKATFQVPEEPRSFKTDA